MLKMKKLRLRDINLSRNCTINVFASALKPTLDLQSHVLQLFLSKAHFPCIHFKGVCRFFFTVKKRKHLSLWEREKETRQKSVVANRNIYGFCSLCHCFHLHYPSYFPQNAMRQVGKILSSICQKKKLKLVKVIQLVISVGAGNYSFIYISFSTLFHFNYIWLKHLNWGILAIIKSPSFCEAIWQEERKRTKITHTPIMVHTVSLMNRRNSYTDWKGLVLLLCILTPNNTATIIFLLCFQVLRGEGTSRKKKMGYLLYFTREWVLILGFVHSFFFVVWLKDLRYPAVTEEVKKEPEKDFYSGSIESFFVQCEGLINAK